MTAPIRVRRRWYPLGFALVGLEFPARPWSWECLACATPDAADCTGLAATHPAALAAGLAHLDTHTET